MYTSSYPSAHGESDKALLRPNTFWELIEKLLLNTTRDEQSRQRHNAALSALCRGHALPRLPREPKPKTTMTTTSNKRATHEGLAVSNSVKGKKQITKQNTLNTTKKKNNVICVSVTPTHSKIDILKNDEKRCKSIEERDKPLSATEVKSECLLNDHDIVYLKDDSLVRPSERLWRYAIRNRKRCEDDRETDNDAIKPTPSIRSNEAIFLALKKRMEEANEEKRSKEIRIKKESEEINRKHNCKHIQKIRSDLTMKNVEKIRNVKRSPSSHGTPLAHIELHKTFIEPPSVPTLQSGLYKTEPGIKRTQSRGQMFSPWGQETGWPDLTKINNVRSKNSFESKKALYNNVIKRRLNCGSQLDSLNKEILTKKSNSNTIQSKETTRKYAEIKSEYLNLCYQESTLRHQIALLHAEIYMMQNKSYHKQPARVKTITFDSVTTPINHKHDLKFNHVTDDGIIPMFPSLKAPKPLITALTKHGLEKQFDKLNKRKRTSAFDIDRMEETSDTSIPVLEAGSGYQNAPVGVCSIYSLTPQIVPQIREPFTLPQRKMADKLIHRLPKMSLEKEQSRPIYTNASPLDNKHALSSTLDSKRVLSSPLDSQRVLSSPLDALRVLSSPLNSHHVIPTA